MRLFHGRRGVFTVNPDGSLRREGCSQFLGLLLISGDAAEYDCIEGPQIGPFLSVLDGGLELCVQDPCVTEASAVQTLGVLGCVRIDVVHRMQYIALGAQQLLQADERKDAQVVRGRGQCCIHEQDSMHLA